MNILPVVVLYNVCYYQCRVYSKLLSHYKSLRIIIYDNSETPQLINDNNIIYFHNKDNGGVSAAYNYGSKIACEIGNIDYLLLLDQDTDFESNYIDVLLETIRNTKDCGIFVPHMFYNGSKPFSPVKKSLFGTRGQKLKDGIWSLSTFFPVNSGVCIKRELFEQIKYDYRIKLDFADIDFFSKIALIHPDFCLVNSFAIQSFSNLETDVSKLLQRYHLYLDGGKVAIKNKLIRKFVIVDIIKHTIGLSLRTRNFVFVKRLFLFFINDICMFGHI